jgi:hypothetical protein
MAIIDNLVHETSASIGTGNCTLIRSGGERRFSEAFGSGATLDLFYYFIWNRDAAAAEWEVGTGHMSDANTLVRDTALKSSNADAKVNFTAGTKEVTNGIPADEFDTIVPNIFSQASAPATTFPEGSLWIDSDSVDIDLYRLAGGVWVDTGVNLKGAPGSTSGTGELNFVDDFSSSAANWRAYHQAAATWQTLFIPPSSTPYSMPGALSPGKPGSVVNAYGAILDITQFVAGVFPGKLGGTLPMARFATADQGDSSVTLLDPATYASFFIVGKWVMLGGVDMQGFGYPANNHIFEFRKITSVDSGTGVIGFEGELRNSYKSTWPLTTAGSPSADDSGGPATIFPMSTGWDQTFIVRGATIPATVANLFGGGRSQLYEDVTFTDACPSPSACMDFTLRRCTFTGGAQIMEMDKSVELFETEKVTGLFRLLTQSSSLDRMVLTDTEIQEVLGVGQRTVINGCEIDKLQLGVTSYGVGHSVRILDSRINVLEYASRKMALTDLESTAAFANGTFTVARSIVFDVGVDIALMMIPGSSHFLTAGSSGDNLGCCFKVLDVTADVNNWYFKTTLADPMPKPIDADLVTGWSSSTKFFAPHPCRSISVYDCDGSLSQMRSLSRAPKGKPLYSHLYTGLITGGGTGGGGKLWGRVERVVITVHRAYTGTVGTLHFRLTGSGGAMYFIKPDQSIINSTLFVNAKVAGRRVFDLNEAINIWDATDGLTDLNLGLWSTNSWGPAMSTSISGENPSVWPIIEMEVFTNQGPETADLEWVI